MSVDAEEQSEGAARERGARSSALFFLRARGSSHPGLRLCDKSCMLLDELEELNVPPPHEEALGARAETLSRARHTRRTALAGSRSASLRTMRPRPARTVSHATTARAGAPSSSRRPPGLFFRGRPARHASSRAGSGLRCAEQQAGEHELGARASAVAAVRASEVEEQERRGGRRSSESGKRAHSGRREGQSADGARTGARRRRGDSKIIALDHAGSEAANKVRAEGRRRVRGTRSAALDSPAYAASHSLSKASSTCKEDDEEVALVGQPRDVGGSTTRGSARKLSSSRHR